jgi:DNA-binding beta-propeller fold protein YncE
LNPYALAFNSAGNLFVADAPAGKVYEFTPGGVQSTFASFFPPGSSYPEGLVFNSAGDLFVSDADHSIIYEYTPGGVRSTFASGIGALSLLAFQPTPVPEPSALGLLSACVAALLVRRR